MVSEQLLNIKFVLEVEKYPCLYNYKLPEYVRKDMVDKAWFEIGKKFNYSGAECKEKWRNIRNVFVRNLKPGKKGHRERRKPYYLNEVMKFTLPFIKWSKVTISGQRVVPKDFPTSNTEESDEEEGGHHRHTPTAIGRQSLSESNPEATPSQQTQLLPMTYLQPRPEPTQSPLSPFSLASSPSDLTSSILKDKARKTKMTAEDGLLEYFKSKHARIETNQDLEQQPKKMFLLSLLPDLENMSDRQMRMFKSRVMSLIEDILDDKPSVSPVDDSHVPAFYEEKEIKVENIEDD